MNKSSVKKKRPAKASRSSAVRKSPNRAAAVRKAASKTVTAKTVARRPVRKPAASASAAKPGVVEALKPVLVPKSVAEPAVTVTVAQVTALSPPLRSHRFRVGQTVFYTSSPISRPGATGTYEVVRLLPSDGDDYQYRIKNPGEAFERVAKESQLELEH
jgi:hypothetical protein